MTMRIGFVGWRGMVGSVLMQRMQEEGDFDGLAASFFSTSQAGKPAPEVGANGPATIAGANDIDLLSKNDVLVTCQGGDYTNAVYPELRKSGWKGYWVDAASALRMQNDARIILDPVNRSVIDAALHAGVKNYIGGNCTVSLMLMGIAELLRRDLVEWISVMTYQAASGAGATKMRELALQMRMLGGAPGAELDNPAALILDIDKSIQSTFLQGDFPVAEIGAPLAGSLIPWIDKPMENGQTKEEWKGMAETNKILGLERSPVPVDGLCVRVGAMRSHSQGLTVKMKRDVPLDEIEGLIAESTEWTEIVPNTKEATLKRLSPAAVSGSLQVTVGRIRKLAMGGDYLTLFTVGDQLLWGAAEPLRRMVRILRERS
ncbi:MAG: aspartate-semialdehyde dehydrogenase [Spirochaetota bacterium]